MDKILYHGICNFILSSNTFGMKSCLEAGNQSAHHAVPFSRRAGERITLFALLPARPVPLHAFIKCVYSTPFDDIKGEVHLK